MPDSTAVLTDMKGGAGRTDPLQNHTPNLLSGISTRPHSDLLQATEFNSTASGLTMLKESVSTDGDSSDSHGRGGSENGTDITLPETDQPDGKGKANTPVDKRIEKRRMKRFRLTHNQTRYLMSEFTRQAHPDAAHRERLSREIPGLSPRQVQVWFQNRRAKLKRLTSDDRERMLSSRALPDDFDMAQALHSPYGNCQPPTSAPIPSPSVYQQDGATMPSSPLFAESFKYYNDEYAPSPLSSISSWNTYFSPHCIRPTGRESSPVHPSEASSSPRYMRPSSFPNPSKPLQSPIQRLQLEGAPTAAHTVSLGSPTSNSLFTPASFNRSASLPSSDFTKRCDSHLHAPLSPSSVCGKEGTRQLEHEESSSSPGKATNESYISPTLQTKPSDKDAKPTVQAPLNYISSGCDSSLNSHFGSPPFGVPYVPSIISALSLPHSQLFIDQNEKSSDHYGSFTNTAGGLSDSFLDQRGVYTFQFAGVQ